MAIYPEYDVEKMSDKEILDKLNTFGLDINIERFKEMALDLKSPSKLAQRWSEPIYHFCYNAVSELWKRHLTHEKNPEILADLVNDIMNTYDDNRDKLDREVFLCIYDKLKMLYHDLLKQDGTPDIALYREVEEVIYDGIEGFVFDIIFDFPGHGLVDEAVDIGRWFAQFSEQPNEWLGNVGCILAEAGRREDAVKQVKENLQNFPNDVWVVVNAGDAMNSLGDSEATEGYFLKAYKMVKDKSDKIDILERIINLYRAIHMDEKARKFEDEYADLTEIPQDSLQTNERVSRNAPCPCGSGKKYKKCCMNKTSI